MSGWAGAKNAFTGRNGVVAGLVEQVGGNRRWIYESFGGFCVEIGRFSTERDVEMEHHQVLTFPVLAAGEIVECMDELRIPVTLADLAKVRAGEMQRRAAHRTTG